MQTAASLNRIEELLTQLFTTQDRTGDSYLKCALTSELTAVFPIDQIEQTTVVPATQVTPVPNQPEWVIGLINLQNTVLMAIDLPQVLGLPMISPLTQQYHIVVVRTQASQQELIIGFVVQQIQGLLKVMPEQIQPSPAIADLFSPQLRPYLQGMLAGDGQTEPLIVLKMQAITQLLLN